MVCRWRFDWVLRASRACGPTAVVLLNRPLVGAMAWVVDEWWRAADLRVVADGAVNHLHAYQQQRGRGLHPPDLIVGDLDSACEHVVRDYCRRGAKLSRSEDQDSTDLDKALSSVREWAAQCERQRNPAPTCHALVCGDLGGRFDHSMAIVSSMVRWAGIAPRCARAVAPHVQRAGRLN